MENEVEFSGFSEEVLNRIKEVEDLVKAFGIKMTAFEELLAEKGLEDKTSEKITNILEDQDKKCPLCSNPMSKKSGPYGEFWGCNNYPNCKGTIKIKSSPNSTGRTWTTHKADSDIPF